MLELPSPKDDGLPKAEVGIWSKAKHHFLRRYIDAFTTSMKEKKWSSLNYIDLFAGPGLETIQETNELIWGSPLIAAHASFDNWFFCELDKNKYNALEQRAKRIRPASKVFHGDANEQVTEIVQYLPPNSLTLAFLDPYGLHLNFETLKILSKHRCDLIIFWSSPKHAVNSMVRVMRPG